MRNKTTYEWKIEYTEDVHNDIVAVDHIEKLTWDFVAQTAGPGEHVVFCLVQNIGNDDDGILDRFHWYPDSQLGIEEFQPPKRYIEEARKFGLVK